MCSRPPFAVLRRRRVGVEVVDRGAEGRTNLTRGWRGRGLNRISRRVHSTIR